VGGLYLTPPYQPIVGVREKRTLASSLLIFHGGRIVEGKRGKEKKSGKNAEEILHQSSGFDDAERKKRRRGTPLLAPRRREKKKGRKAGFLNRACRERGKREGLSPSVRLNPSRNTLNREGKKREYRAGDQTRGGKGEKKKGKIA